MSAKPEPADDADPNLIVWEEFWEALRRGGDVRAWLADHPEAHPSADVLRVLADLHDTGRLLLEDSCVGADAATPPEAPRLPPGTVVGHWVLGDALGCGALSELVLADDGPQRDAARAAALARAACDGGDGHGCARLAELCNDRLFYPSRSEECSRENVMRLRDRAVASLDSSCEGWAAYDCYTLATIYASGDPGMAIRFADGSCAAGDPGGCDLLGALYERAGDVGRARIVSDRACRAGYAGSCARVNERSADSGSASAPIASRGSRLSW